VGRRVVKLYLSVAAMGEHRPATRQHRTHWHLTAISRASGFFHGQGHATLIPFTKAHSGASL
jgi:hypothetical protein